MASGDKNYDIAKQSTLTTSVGSSNSEIINTSLFGKINNLINTLATHVANWTSARAEKIDTIATDSASAKADAADIKTTIGATGDTGGSASAGSVMAKLNNIRSYVATTTTSSKTGTLSTKLNYLINNTDFSGTGKGTTIYSKTTSTSVGTSSYAGGHKCHAKFIAPVEGWYTITLTNSSSTSTR